MPRASTAATEAGSQPIPTEGDLQCPHCEITRGTIEEMSEHVDARHADKQIIAGSQTTIPGEAQPMTEYINAMDRLAQMHRETRPHLDPNSNQDYQFAEDYSKSAPEWRKGEKVPEFMPMWDLKARRHRVKSADSFRLMMQKGWTATPPSVDTYNQFWFHWRCPLSRCRDNTDWCQVHGDYGADSDHELMSPDYMVLHHLQHGNRAHRMFFEMNKEDLKKQYPGAWRALEAQDKDEEEKRMEAQDKAEAALRSRVDSAESQGE